MTWLAVRLLLSGALKRLGGFLSGLTFWQIVSLGLAAFTLVQHFELKRSRAEAARWHHQYDGEHAGRVSDRAAYVKAQADAAARNKAQVVATEQEYQRITDNAKDAYARDHAELVRMRSQRAAQGSAGTAASPQDHPAPGGAHGDGVQVPPGNDLQAKDDAADIELRLMHLQNYVEGLLGIDPNGVSK